MNVAVVKKQYQEEQENSNMNTSAAQAGCHVPNQQHSSLQDRLVQKEEDPYMNASVAKKQYQEKQEDSNTNTSNEQVDCQLSNQQHSSLHDRLALSLTNRQHAEALLHFSTAATPSSGDVKSNLVKGSRVQMAPSGPDESLMYGEIKWIGHVPGNESAVAGIELVRY